MQHEEVASESSSEEEEPSTERPYNSLLQLLNAKSETSHARKRRKLDHVGEKRDTTSRELEIQVTTEELEELDVLENQEASDEEDNVGADKAGESDDEDEDEDGKDSVTFFNRFCMLTIIQRQIHSKRTFLVRMKPRQRSE